MDMSQVCNCRRGLASTDPKTARVKLTQPAALLEGGAALALLTSETGAICRGGADTIREVGVGQRDPARVHPTERAHAGAGHTNRHIDEALLAGCGELTELGGLAGHTGRHRGLAGVQEVHASACRALTGELIRSARQGVYQRHVRSVGARPARSVRMRATSGKLFFWATI